MTKQDQRSEANGAVEHTETMTDDGAGPAAPSSSSLPADGAGSSYDIRGEHARGGLGRVLRAEDRRLGRIVAIKELLRQGQEASQRFLREVQLTARLQHPGIVPIYETGNWRDGTPFYSMKFIDGATLKDVLRAHASLDERLALLPKLVVVAETIAYAHSEGVIHRDLKPSNVLIGPFGETVVVDWGLAKEIAAPSPPSAQGPYREAAAVWTTVDGAVLGTPAYMAPEQARGEEATTRSDVYALGAMVYELLVGEPPYRGGSRAEVLHHVAAGPPPPIALRVSGAPRDLVAIVDKAMARDPARRYATAAELAADLTRFQTGQLVNAHEYSRGALLRRWTRRHRRVLAVAGAALLLLTLLAVAAFTRIVHERDVARARGNQLILTHAESQLETDPTAAVAWAKTYPLDGGDHEKVRALLAEAESRGVARHVFRRDSPYISIAAFSHDGTRLAVEEDHNTIAIRDVATGRSIARIPHGGMAATMAWTGDDRFLLVTDWLRRTQEPLELIDVAAAKVQPLGVTVRTVLALAVRGNDAVVGNGDGPVQLWDLATRSRRTVATHTKWVSHVAFSHDGALVVSSGFDGVINVYERKTGQLHAFNGGVSVRDFALTPAGDSVIAGCDDGSVVRWDVATGARKLLGRHDARVMVVAVSHDGRWAASGSDDHTVRLWNLETGTSRVLAGHTAPIRSIAFSPTAPLLATGSVDTTIRLWHLESLWSSVLRGHGAAVQDIGFSDDGRHLFSAAEDKTTRLWDIGDALQPSELVGHTSRATVVVHSSDGQLLASAGEDHTVRMWRLPSGAPAGTHVERRTPLVLAFSPDASRIAAATVSAVVVWDARTGREQSRFPYPVAVVDDLQYSRDGHRLAVARSDGTVHVMTDGREQTLVVATSPVRALAFSPDGATLVTAGDDHVVRSWDLATGRARVLGTHGDLVISVAFSPDGHQVASASFDATVKLYDLARGTSRTWKAPSKQQCVAFSPSGRWLASAGRDGDVTLHDLHDGGRERRLFGHQQIVDALKFSPDERLLATASWDQTVRLWSVASGELVRVYRSEGPIGDADFPSTAG